ncbi:hypothetical protein, partial [Escherichia coli]|uniref:hypothetical protein n=1 Tax=Escherichia coli TaxID=562 RepID=UPI001B3C9790
LIRDITKLPELRKVFLGLIFDKGHKILPPTIHHRHPLHSTMTILAVVAVHLVAVALPGAGNKRN